MQIKSLSVKMDTTKKKKKSVGKDTEEIQENAFP